MKKNLLFLFLIFLIVNGCTYSQVMISPSGQSVRCSATGWGYIGAPVAMGSVSNCIESYRQLGFAEIEKIGVPGFYMSEGDPPTILKVQSLGPAARAGILAGDRLITVNGKTCHCMKDVLILGFGPPGKVNTYEVLRENEKMIFSFAMASKIEKLE